MSLTAHDIDLMGRARRVRYLERNGVTFLACGALASSFIRVLFVLLQGLIDVSRYRDRRDIVLEPLATRGASPIGGGKRGRPQPPMRLSRSQRKTVWLSLTRAVQPGDRLGCQWERDGQALLLGILRHGQVVQRWRFARPRRRARQTARALLRPDRVAITGVAAWAVATQSLTVGLAASFLACLWLARGVVASTRTKRQGPLHKVLRAVLLWFFAASSPVLAGLVSLVIGVAVVRRFRRAVHLAPPAAEDWGGAARVIPVREAGDQRTRSFAAGVAARGGAAAERCRERVTRALPWAGNGDAAAPAANATAALYRDHVGTTAMVLDRVTPGWADRVAVEEVDPADAGGSVLEAVFGSYDQGLEAMVDFARSSGGDGHVECVQASLGDRCPHTARMDAGPHQAALFTAWTEEIIRRTSGQPSAV